MRSFSLNISSSTNFVKENLDWPSNTATKSDSDRLRLGFSGFMQVTRPAARRVSEISPTVRRFPGDKTATLIFSNCSRTGCKMGKLGNGSLFSITSMMTSSFKSRPLLGEKPKTPRTMPLRGHRYGTCLKPRLALSLLRAGIRQ